MTKHITSTTEFELKVFHPGPPVVAPAESCTVSVNFGFASDGPASDDAKADFLSFLKVVKDARFLPYRFTISGSQVTISPAPGVTCDTAAWVRPLGLANEIYQWLQDRSGGKWIANALQGDEINYKEVAAPHLLDSASCWDAPLPELAGLTRLVRLNSTGPLAPDLILVPWFDSTNPGAIKVKPLRIWVENSVQHVDVELSNVESGGLTDVVIRTQSLIPSQDPGSLIDESTGYLKVQKRCIQIADAVRRLCELTPSLLWTLPQLTSLQWDQDEAVANNKPSPSHDDLKRAIWLGVSGLTTMLDPLLLGLTMAGPPREGPFVAAFIALLDEQNALLLEERKKDSKYGPYGTFNLKGLADTITDLILKRVNQKAEIRAEMLAKAFDWGALPTKKALNAGAKLLPVLLSLYHDFTPNTLPEFKPDTPDPDLFDPRKARERFGNSLARQTIVELQMLSKLMQDEDAIEKAALRILAQSGVDAKFLMGLLENSNAAGAQKRCDDTLAAFRMLLSESFNGLDATRFAVGSLFESALITEAEKLKKKDGWDDDDLKNLLLESNWFAARLGLGAPVPKPTQPDEVTLAKLAALIPCVDLDYLDDKHEKDLHIAAANPKDRNGTLDNALKIIVEELFLGDRAVRFLPDSYPRDLPVQIAVDNDTKHGDTFQSRFNGVGLLVRRIPDSWRYANYATLKPNYPKPPNKIADKVIHPLQPVEVDGQRRLFVDYSGVPFASKAFAGISAKGAAMSEPEKHPEFYEVEDPVLAREQCLPALAYGKTYAIAGHVVSKAGVLPTALQRSPDMPWLPAEKPDVPTQASPVIVRETPYLRATAVGRVTLSESPLTGKSSRIGVSIEGVRPLASDYPRLALAAPDASIAMLDVLRNSDGTGAITLPTATGERFDLNIADLQWWGKGGELTIEVLNQADAYPDAPSNDSKAIYSFSTTDAFFGGSIALRIQLNGADREFSVGIAQTSEAAQHLKPISPDRLNQNTKDTKGNLAGAWLRLRLKGEGAGISFADPTAEVRTKHSASRSGADSLLLLAPEAPEWQDEVKEEVTATLRFPQVSFVDFDRWFSNERCQAIAFPTKNGEQPEDAEARARDFHTEVMTAYFGRMLDPGLAKLVDAMPDLAVSGLRLDLFAVDGLASKPSELVKNQDLLPKTAKIEIDPLGERKEVSEKVETHAKLKLLAGSSGANLKVTCSGTKLGLKSSRVQGAQSGTRGWQVDVTVPRGVVARLRVRAVVPEHFFSDGLDPLKVFDDRVRQLAVAHIEGAYLFEGPSITIEGMLGELSPLADKDRSWIDLCHNSVSVVATGNARSYDLVTRHQMHDELDAWNWRKLGSIDVQTQRWRFTGRPIYNWLEPKQGRICTVPAVRIADGTKGLDLTDLEAAPGLDEFEKEAFFDRDAQDADIQRKDLDPAPAVTVLQSFPWDQPSATLFRHRLTLRSRYAGALLPDRPSTQKGYASDGKKREEWIRVAMLADRTRLQLTRPQLRALIPLTVSPTEGANDAAAPPVMAVLEEPPFVHGGLADRISAEIRTGFGYGFGSTPPLKDIVHIVDSRKEVGPDPRLKYAPTPKEMALALTLENEGPIGLTFDTPTAPAPRFANSTLLLRPLMARSQSPEAGSLEEHFLSVGLRRYLDHKWLIDEPEEIRGSARIAEPHWIEFSQSVTLTAGALDVLDISLSARVWKAEVNPEAIDPEVKVPLAMIDLAQADASFANQLAILHLPLEEGRASLTLFALREPRAASSRSKPTDAATGGSNLPLVLASFEWRVPEGVTELTFSKPPNIRPTSASPVTQMNWTRTGKSFDALDVISQKGVEARVNVDDLVCTRTASKTSLNLMRRGTPDPLHVRSQLERNPLFVHRHLAAISTVKAGGVGRPIDVFHNAKRVIGKDLAINLPDNSDGATLRIVTFETPARPLGYNAPLLGMQSAKFDLFAVIGDKYDDGSKLVPIGLSFTYRPLGDVSGDSALTSLGFKVTFNGTSSSFAIDLTKYQNKRLSAVHFSIIAKEISWICVFVDGSTTVSQRTEAKFTFTIDLAKTTDFETIEITPEGFTKAKGDISEYWGDISMLTIPFGAEMNSFSWDWMFTGRNLLAATAVTTAQLLKVAEAEARIVAISPPIPVK